MPLFVVDFVLCCCLSSFFCFFFFFFKQKTAYEITRWLEFRRVLFRSVCCMSIIGGFLINKKIIPMLKCQIWQLLLLFTLLLLFQMNDWIYYETVCSNMNFGRGLVTGKMYSENGELLATITQETLFRTKLWADNVVDNIFIILLSCYDTIFPWILLLFHIVISVIYTFLLVIWLKPCYLPTYLYRQSLHTANLLDYFNIYTSWFHFLSKRHLCSKNIIINGLLHTYHRANVIHIGYNITYPCILIDGEWR